MPQLGLTMTEGAVTTWVKQPGDHVAKGDIVFTVETDKSEMEVESFGVGYLTAPLVEIGQVVPVGTVLAYLTERPGDELPVRAGDAAVPAARSPASARAGEARLEPPELPQGRANRAAVSPRARALAAQLGIDVETLSPARGTRITEADVRRASEVLGEAAVGGARKRASAIKKVTAKRMTASFQTAPHFYLGVGADATALVRLRERLLPEIEQATGLRITYTDFFILALARALVRHPEVNMFWSDGDLVSCEIVNVSFAVDTPEGLVAPVIRNADRLDLSETVRERSRLVSKARTGSLAPADMEQGSATLSNLGGHGVDWFQAILNPPQSVVLATGRIAPRPVVDAGGMVDVRDYVTLTLSADHRVLDGVMAARFLTTVRDALEQPESLRAPA
jgi:pyruvate dehydrogenase E2 component (dihydrolipoamide acetyltransferase)